MLYKIFFYFFLIILNLFVFESLVEVLYCPPKFDIKSYDIELFFSVCIVSIRYFVILFMPNPQLNLNLLKVFFTNLISFFLKVILLFIVWVNVSILHSFVTAPFKSEYLYFGFVSLRRKFTLEEKMQYFKQLICETDYSFDDLSIDFQTLYLNLDKLNSLRLIKAYSEFVLKRHEASLQMLLQTEEQTYFYMFVSVLFIGLTVGVCIGAFFLPMAGGVQSSVGVPFVNSSTAFLAVWAPGVISNVGNQFTSIPKEVNSVFTPFSNSKETFFEMQNSIKVTLFRLGAGDDALMGAPKFANIHSMLMNFFGNLNLILILFN